MAEELKGMAAIAKGIVGTFDEDAKVLLKVFNCELLLNNNGTHMAIIDPRNNSFAGFYRAQLPEEKIQAAQDFVKYAGYAYKQFYGFPWKQRK